MAKSNSLPAPSWMPLGEAVELAFRQAMGVLSQCVPEEDLDQAKRMLATRIRDTGSIRVGALDWRKR